MRGVAQLLLCMLPLAASAETSSTSLVCIPSEVARDPVRFDVDETAHTVTLFKTGETFVMAENTPTQLTFEAGDPQGELTLNYIAKIDANTPGDWIADTIDNDGNVRSERIGVCFAL